jgi:hypothetical protein
VRLRLMSDVNVTMSGMEEGFDVRAHMPFNRARRR